MEVVRYEVTRSDSGPVGLDIRSDNQRQAQAVRSEDSPERGVRHSGRVRGQSDCRRYGQDAGDRISDRASFGRAASSRTFSRVSPQDQRVRALYSALVGQEHRRRTQADEDEVSRRSDGGLRKKGRGNPPAEGNSPRDRTGYSRRRFSAPVCRALGQYPADGLQSSGLPRPAVAVGPVARHARTDRPGQFRAGHQVPRGPQPARHAHRAQLVGTLSLPIALFLENGAGRGAAAVRRPDRETDSPGRPGDRHGGNSRSRSAAS